MKLRNLLVLMVISLAFTFVSCISVDRKLTLNADGSGEEIMKITYHKEFYTGLGTFMMMFDSTGTGNFMDSVFNMEEELNGLRSEFNTKSGIKLIDLKSEFQPDSSNVVTVNYLFDNVAVTGQTLRDINETFESQDAAVTYAREGDELVYRYIIEVSPDDSTGGNDSLGAGMMKSLAEMFSAGSFRYEMLMPADVITSNATFQDGRTLVWNFPMNSLMQGGKLMLEAKLRPE